MVIISTPILLGILLFNFDPRKLDTSCSNFERMQPCEHARISPVVCDAGSYSPVGVIDCKECAVGHYCPVKGAHIQLSCPPGSYSLVQGAHTCLQCPTGYQCQSISKAPIPCPIGHYADATGSTVCHKCPIGYYAILNGSTHCNVCPAGHKCPLQNMHPIPCDEREYQPEEGKEFCLKAPLGMVVVDAASLPVTCHAGEFSNGTACVSCLLGHYCPSSASSPIPCPSGTYADTFGMVYCTLCPPGSHCLKATDTPAVCQKGTFSTAGQIKCESCLDGHYSFPGASSCMLCPGGMMCSNGTTTIPPVPCSAGQFSPLGSNECRSCLKNMYSNTGSHSCLPCPEGYLCHDPSGKPKQCLPGYYWNKSNEATTCVICPSGYECLDTTKPPAPCLSGNYSTGANSTCTACPAGMSCLDPRHLPQNCDVGTYSSNGETHCSPCPAGMYCTSTLAIDGACLPGTYSLKGEATCSNCSAGFMCPNMDSPPFPCVSGQTTDAQINQQICRICPAGYACPTPASKMIKCEAGYFSLGVALSCSNCPAGYQCPTTNKRPIICPPGKYSSGGQTSCFSCAAGFACPSVSKNATLVCPPGTYSLGNQSKCLECPKGVSCPNAATIASCNKGEYSLPGSSDCLKCPRGWMCPLVDGSANERCNLGSYSPVGATKCTICPAGKACSHQEISAPTDCKPGTFSNGEQVKCTPCPAGFQCPDITDSSKNSLCNPGSFSERGDSTCTQCPAGYACPSIQQRLMISCQLGSYSLGGKTHCTLCENGKYCPKTGEVGIDCEAGQYSLEGAYKCTDCPSGYYCETTDDDPRICREGQFSLKQKTRCSDCDLGYVCEEGSTTATPESGRCPKGYYCDDRVSKTACSPGKYGIKEGASSEVDGCVDCLEGYFCGLATAGYPTKSIVCPAGHYCPRGTQTAFQYPCEDGKYSRDVGLVRKEQCKTCPVGRYCAGGDPTGDQLCPKGHYCIGGASKPAPCLAGLYTEREGAISSSECKDCPAGYYCPSGTESPLPCEPGTYNPVVQQGKKEDCRKCMSGWACPQLALTYPTEVCSAGYYCPAGSKQPNETLNACPPGTYTDFHNGTSDSHCSTCPAGKACTAGTGGKQKPLQRCAPGYFCPAGTRHPKQYPCPGGTWSNSTNLEASDGCTACPKGWYCLKGSSVRTGICPTGHYCPPETKFAKQYPCSPGTFSSETGNERWEVCKVCPMGNFCPKGSSEPTNCPRGFYRDELKGEQLGDCKPCIAGYSCSVDGTIKPAPCGIGNYSSSRAYVCSLCKEGYFCMSNTTDYSTMSTKFICPAGMYCKEGLDHQPYPQANPCWKGYYCVQGDEYPRPQPCPIGTYNSFTNLKHVRDCVKCPAGYYCSPEGQTNPTAICPDGHYCPEGTGSPNSYPCAAGFYRNGSAAVSSMDCSKCISGMYCNEKGMSWPNNCPPGYYCPTGSLRPEPCPSGYFSNETNLKRSEDCLPCPAGQYCAGTGKIQPTGLCDAGFYCKGAAYTSAPPGGITGGLCPKGGFCKRGAIDKAPCPDGRYNPHEGAKSAADCSPCPSGFYCAGSLNADPTGPCKAGYFCNGSSTTPTQYISPKGHFAIEGSPAATHCPVGTFQSKAGSSWCEDCLESAYCDTAGLEEPKNCLKGFYCPAKSKIPKACPRGTYNPEISKILETDCKDCDPGQYCDTTGLNATSGNCDAGYFCTKRSPYRTPGNTSTGLDSGSYPYGGVCPQGHYCPVGTKRATDYPCRNGTYNPLLGATNDSYCLPCTGGRVCSALGLSAPNGYCSPGFYCIKGATYGKPIDGIAGDKCPAGSYCPRNSSTYQTCDPGTFSNITGLAECYQCPAGYYCSDGVNPIECPVGYYCLEGSRFTDKRGCPPGTYGLSPGLAAKKECLPCPSKKYCAKYAVTEFLSNNGSGLCDPGFFCETGVDSKRPGTNSTGIGGVCPVGSYCPLGTDVPYGCLVGTYSNVTGLKTASECIPCDYGRYCNKKRLNKPSGKCDAGFYCLRGATQSSIPTLSESGGPCPIGKYCPEGTSFPLGCPQGTYMPIQGASKCWPCLAGYYCPANISDYSPFPCPEGHYCPNGTEYATQHPCRSGTFRNNTNGQNITDCSPCSPGYFCANDRLIEPDGKCSAGYFCLGGAKTSRPLDLYDVKTGDCSFPSNITGGECPEGYFCPEGTAKPLACPGGFYCSGKRNSKQTGPCKAGYYCQNGSSTATPMGIAGDKCPAGKYCKEGTEFPDDCPSGTYSNATGNKMESNCLMCETGKYCSGTGNTKPTGPCGRGFYCPAGQSQKDPPTYTCNAGYYCPEGSPKQVICESGTWTDLTKQWSCKQCVEGYFCDRKNGPISDYTSHPCPVGFYCLNGTKFATEFGCPNGTYGNETKLKHPGECLQCPAGKYCHGALSTWTGNCSARYHCISGSWTPTPTDGISGRTCPEGSYCPEGAPTPIKCPAGTFNNHTGLAMESECTDCAPGMYCLNDGLVYPSGFCDERYFCELGAVYAKSLDKTTGGNCTIGHYCPVGTKLPIPCQDGKYMPDILAKECWTCPAGSYCIEDHVTLRPCPQGFYCPDGTGFDWKACPPGTFNDQVGLSNITSCQSCTPGMYCPYYNATTPEGFCSKGYYCELGSNTDKPETNHTGIAGPCTLGNYCPSNTSTPQPCPLGRFGNITHLMQASDCQLCNPGFYCGSEGLVDVSGPCDAGFYCLYGSKVSNPPSVTSSGGPCPVGHYCPGGTSFPLACKKGTFNSRTGQTECDQCCPGYYCPENTTTCTNLCPKGYFCPKGTSHPYANPCPPGTYNNETGKSVEKDCIPCEPGKYCPSSGAEQPFGDCDSGWYCRRGAWSAQPIDLGNTTSDSCFCSNVSTGGQCQPGQFCPTGSTQPQSCTAGFYCATTGLANVTGPCAPGSYCTLNAKINAPLDNITGNICPAGSYCPLETSVPKLCPPGTYSSAIGNVERKNCLDCEPGQFCSDWGMTHTNGNCSAGYYCPPGQSSSAPEKFRCTPGYYCPPGSTEKNPCQSGSYQDKFGKATCKMCPGHYFCDGLILNETHCSHGVQFPKPCPQGYYCPDGMKTGKEHPCPSGTYGATDKLFEQEDCTNCPTGKFCEGGGLDTWSGECEAGYFCKGKADTKAPNDGVTGILCPPGYFCPTGTNATKPCPPGTYNPSYGISNEDQCLGCTEGEFCDKYGQNMTSGNCTGGYYCNSNSSTSKPRGLNGGICPTGSYCPSGSSEPKRCLPGTYMNHTGASSCYDCPERYFCTNSKIAEPCLAGFFCPANTGYNLQPCPTGTVSSSLLLSSSSECSSCTAGQFCDQLNATSTSGPCDAGFYCLNGSDTATPSGGHKGKAGVCPEGSYCPSGNSSSPIACPAGTFNNKTHGESILDCLPCIDGHYCEGDGLSAPTARCDPGYFCKKGAKVSNPAITTSDYGPCPVGHYCPGGTSSPYKCKPGTYNGITKQSRCLPCLSGHFCKVGAYNVTECPVGYYCPNGSKLACPEGTFKNFTMGSNISSCKPCPAGSFCEGTGNENSTGLCAGGWYCSGGSWTNKPIGNESYAGFCSLLKIGGMCTFGTFCPPGSEAPIPCTPGFYCNANELSAESGPCGAGYYCNGSTIEEHPVNKTYGDICPPGHYCEVGSKGPAACLAGHFARGFGNDYRNACIPCLAGKYCDRTGLAEPAGSCTKGFYCPTGEVYPEPPDKKCKPGHYCPTGSHSHNVCPPGTYQPLAERGFCIDCPDGYYCDPTEAHSLNASGINSTSHGVVNPSICPAGYYCPNRTITYASYPCRRGYFGNETKLSHHDQCHSCTPGYYCDREAMTYPEHKCHVGYYCEDRAITPQPNNASEGGGPCAQGYYCESGYSKPLPCPPGTYGDRPKLGHLNECTDCEGGNFCATFGIPAPNGTCLPGYYCKGSAILPNPEGESYGDVCPMGYYCPSGTTTPFTCPPGTYNNQSKATRAQHCLPCPGGMYCAGYANKLPDDFCDEGYFCERGAYTTRPVNYTNISHNSSILYTCPIYSVNQTGSICPQGSYCPKGSSRPVPCDRGKHCDIEGLSLPVGSCSAGFFCDFESVSSTPRKCQAGHYCEEGTPVEKQCPIGTFNPEPGRDYCENCTAGFYCPNLAMTEAIFQCLQGFYCPSGSERNDTIECPRGFYCGTGADVPNPCPAGEYQSEKGGYKCDVCPRGYVCDPTSLSPGQGIIQPQNCTPGYYCPSNTSSIRQYPCPPGSYSDKIGLESNIDCSPCDAGFYCAGHGNTTITGPCSPGYYCKLSASTPTPIDGLSGNICPEGKYCLEQSTEGTDCPPGTFGNTTGLHNASSCTPCEAGWYCPSSGATKPFKECEAGHWCISGSTEPTPDGRVYGIKCPNGSYCPKGTPSPLKCPEGTYQPDEQKSQVLDCLDCPSGSFCDSTGLTNTSGLCQRGYYCSGSAKVMNPTDNSTGNVCPIGTYCPSGSKSPHACEKGTYMNNTGAWECLICPPGYMCTRQVAADLCEQGYFCPSGTGFDIQPCPPGTYGARPGLKDVFECTNCTAGSYCEGNGLSRPSGVCDPGHWCESKVNTKAPTGTGHTGIGGLCTKGHECPANTSSPIPCKSGFYSTIDGAVSACFLCPAGKYCNDSTIHPYDCAMGHYCLNGTKTPTQYPCPPGTFNNKTGQSTELSCSLCPPGLYCEGYGRVSPNGQCDPGFFCRLGAVSARPGVYGSIDLTKATSENSTCYKPYGCVCPLFNETRGDICPAGHYCPQGSVDPVDCPAGKFCEHAGLESPTANCSAGYYCTGRSTTPRQVDCPSGSYCPSGVETPKACPIGTFLNDTNNDERSDCINCTAGWYCETEGLSRETMKCAARYYCPGGQSTATPSEFPCLPGHYCTEGSEYPTPCGNGTYQNVSTQESCLLCPPGFYCDPAEGPVVTPKVCPAGYYCPAGTSYKKTYPCEAGTFGPIPGFARKDQCFSCVNGSYCETDGLSTPTANCYAGYYCMQGAKSPTPIKHINDSTWKFEFYNDQCPKGFFCPSGTAEPKPCPRGYYSGKLGLRFQDECDKCPVGKYCDMIGAKEITNPPNCSAGFVCVSASFTSQPTDGVRGYMCPKGFYCPEGTHIEKGCVPGTYQANRAQGNCTICEPGYMCPEYNMSKPILCKPGFYCPGGVARPCPPGTFKNNSGVSLDGSCTDCPQGMYCDGPGNTRPDGFCDKGYYCEGGAAAKAPITSHPRYPLNGPCPLGHYCPPGVAAPKECPRGTYRDNKGASTEEDCYACKPGFYCDRTGLTECIKKCKEGWYCPDGYKNMVSTPKNFTCWVGHYCPNGTSTPKECETGTYQPGRMQSSCIDCPAGYYCKNKVSELEKCPPRHYCPLRSEIPKLCPNGTYSENITGLETSGQCPPCPAGSYCKTGIVVGKCSAGYWCQSGALSPIPSNESNSNITLAGPCPPAVYCPLGTIVPIGCPNGTFKDYYGGVGSVDDCWPCPAGQECFGADSRIHPCPSGKYCPRGHLPIDCPVLTYRDKEWGQNISDCYPCPAGFWCHREGMSSYNGTMCPVGRYCSEGQTPVWCPAGRRRILPGAWNADQCTPCPSGYFCPFASTNYSGIPCPAKTFCQNNLTDGAAIPQMCPGGYWCPAQTGKPLVCPGGYFCPNATDYPFRCEYPYYCPQESSHLRICPLGYKAVTTSGNRTSREENCLICSAGFYGNHVMRLNCTECPAGYYCPRGTKDPHEHACPKGFYCPAGSAEGVPCQPGMYGNVTKGTKSSDCLPCPENTFNNLKGMEACRPCGSSAESEPGQSKCTCLGKHRSFQVSDGSCECESGFIYYDVVDAKQTEGNSDKSCQPIVADRCSGSYARESNSLQCINTKDIPTNYCNAACGAAGGNFNVTEGRCTCREYTVIEEVCNTTCQAQAPTVQLQRHSTGLLNMIITEASGRVSTVPITREYGINDFDYAKRRAEIVDFTADGSFGILPKNNAEVIDIITKSTSTINATRFRREISFGYASGAVTSGIRAPIVCVNVGQVVVFSINVDPLNRSASNYPRYSKNHLFNTNPYFDYGVFRQLHLLIQKTNLTLKIFANVFSEPGKFVFYDNAVQQRETIIVVPTLGSTCPARMGAQDPVLLTMFSVGPQNVRNLAPNWDIIWAVIGVMFVIVVLLVILAILWRPRAIGIYPLSILRPKYKGLGAPLPVVPLPGVDDNPDGLGPRGDPEGASSNIEPYQTTHGPGETGLLENFNVRTLYDKLEDQTLHISSQLARHQADLRGFYDRISQQSEGLKNLLDNLDVSKLAQATEKAAAMHVDSDDTMHGTQREGVQHGADPTMQYALTGGAAAREAELQRTVQTLLERYGGALQPIAGGITPGAAPWGGLPGQQYAGAGVAGGYPGGNPLSFQSGMWGGMPKSQAAGIGITGELPAGARNTLGYTHGQSGNIPLDMAQRMQGSGLGGGVQFRAGDFGSLLHTMNAERMQLEAVLREAEDQAMKEFSDRKELERQNMMKDMAQQLVEQLAGVMDPDEINAIMERHNEKMSEMEEQFIKNKEREQQEMINELAEKREKKLDALRWKHEQLALQNNIKLADVGSVGDIPVELATQQSALDLAALDHGKALSEGEAELTSNDAKEYGNLMSDKFSKQMDKLVENGSLYTDQAQDLMNKELEMNEKMERDMELKKAGQLAAFHEKLAKRKEKRMKQLKARQELEREQALKDGKDITELDKMHEKEREVLEATFDAEEAEQIAEINKKLNQEHKAAVRQAHRDLLDQMVQQYNVDESAAQAIVDQLRKDNDAVISSLDKKRIKNLDDLKAKLEARKVRRQNDIKRQGQEDASQRILEEQSKLALQSKPTGVEHIVIPNVVAGQSPEEQALRNEQSRFMDVLRETHEEDLEKLGDKLDREGKEEEAKALSEFEEYRQRALREIKNRQAAELTSRTDLTSDETKKMLAAHQKELENLTNSLDAEKVKQEEKLKEKLAEKRRLKLEALKKKQGNEVNKELLEQKKELADAERNALKEAEREAMLAAIRENGAESTEYIIKKILEQRQAKEVADLEKLFAEERKVEIDDVLTKLDEKHMNEKDEMKAKHEKEYKDLEKEGLIHEELQQQRAELFNQQQLEMSDLEKKQADEKKSTQKNASSDWELRYAKAKLELKERHYQEYADYLSEMSPDQASDHQSSIRQAQEAARELQEVRLRLDEQKKEQEEKLKREMEEFEAAERKRMEAELAAYEKDLEEEAEEDRKKNEKTVLALNARKEALLKEKKVKAKKDISNLIKEGGSKEDQEALLKEHSKDLASLMNKMDADRMRMQSQLEKRLKNKRKERRQSKLKDVERKAEEAREEFQEQLDCEEDKLKNDAKMILNETVNVDNLVQSIPDPNNKSNDDMYSQMPTSYQMAAPMSDNELINLLMQSPLYERLQSIRDTMNGDTLPSPKDKQQEDAKPYIDERDDKDYNKDGELVPVDLDSVNAREFVIYKFSSFIRDLLGVHCLHKPVNILLADKLPPNTSLQQNAYRNSFYYDPNNRLLYLRRDRLENVGEFILVLVHTLSHIHVGDMRNDADPKFVKEFYKALSVVCSDLFLSRYKKSNALNEAVSSKLPDLSQSEDVGKKILKAVIGDTHDEIDRENVVDDLLDTKLIRNKHNESKTFGNAVMFQRLRRYTDFIASNKLRNFLGEVEDKLSDASVQGSETEVDKRLEDLKLKIKNAPPVSRYVPSKIDEISKQNTRNLALSRSSVPLSFVTTESRSRRHQPDGEDFYGSFLKTQIHELEEKVDEIDYEFVTLTSQTLELSKQVKNLEREIASHVDMIRNTPSYSPNLEKLSSIARMSNSKLSAAREQLSQAMIAKSERFKRLQEYKKELEERKFLLDQHHS